MICSQSHFKIVLENLMHLVSIGCVNQHGIVFHFYELIPDTYAMYVVLPVRFYERFPDAYAMYDV